MKKTLIFIFFSISIQAQTDIKSFFALSEPKKKWVLLHFLKAKKAYEISVEVTHIVDSIGKITV